MKKLLSRVVAPESSRGAFPGFGATDVGGGTLAIKFEARNVHVLGEKFVRIALWALRGGEFVETTHRIETHVVHAHAVPDVVASIARQGVAEAIAPGAQISITTPSDDPRTHLILFELWGRVRLLTSVLPAEAHGLDSLGTSREPAQQSRAG